MTFPTTLKVHASELPYVFDDANGNTFAPPAKRMATRMGTSWTNLAQIGGTPGDGWPLYAAASDQNIVLDRLTSPADKFAVESGRRKKYCDFWATGPIPE